ncbi:MAG: hypothetical protein ACLSHC_11480 [Bilophila wadsworthia]
MDTVAVLAGRLGQCRRARGGKVHASVRSDQYGGRRVHRYGVCRGAEQLPMCKSASAMQAAISRSDSVRSAEQRTGKAESGTTPEFGFLARPQRQEAREASRSASRLTSPA